MPPSRRLLLRVDAVFDAVVALVLLSASWDALYDALGLPIPRPAYFPQLLGAALVTLAIIEWLIAGRRGQREVALGAGIGSGLGALVLVVWLATGRSGAEPHGQVLLWAVAALLAVATVLHARVALGRHDYS